MHRVSIQREQHVFSRTDIRIHEKAYPTKDGVSQLILLSLSLSLSLFFTLSILYSFGLSPVSKLGRPAVTRTAHDHGRREILANR